MKKLLIFAALAALLFLFFELPNVIKLFIYAAVPILIGFITYLQEREQSKK
jgi:hypothetical protein